MTYTQTEWLLFFFTYCILGWIWESCYVSLKNREWVNRGFLYGPWLPIYGSGAVSVLILTLPVRDSRILIFVFGMIGASLLEYCTGASMEHIFHMRYWDYSDQPCNINGHICLLSSVLWGFFSLLLVKVIHPPLEQLVLDIKDTAADLLVQILTVLFAADATKSVQTALDLKDLLIRISENNQMLENLEARMDSAANRIALDSGHLKEKLQLIENTIAERKLQLRQTRVRQTSAYREALLELLTEHRNRKARILAALEEKAEILRQGMSAQLQRELSPQEQERLLPIKNAVSEFHDLIHQIELELASQKSKDFQKALSMLHRNPTSSSRRHEKALSELNRLKASLKNRKTTRR